MLNRIESRSDSVATSRACRWNRNSPQEVRQFQSCGLAGRDAAEKKVPRPGRDGILNSVLPGAYRSIFLRGRLMCWPKGRLPWGWSPAPVSQRRRAGEHSCPIQAARHALVAPVAGEYGGISAPDVDGGRLCPKSAPRSATRRPGSCWPSGARGSSWPGGDD